MLVVDDGLETHVGFFDHQQIDFLAYRVVGRYLVQIAVQARGGGNAAGALVQIGVHHAVLAGTHLTLLFGKRQQ
ncbi:hypothetical protein D3C86_1893930 [compost metagenome]